MKRFSVFGNQLYKDVKGFVWFNALLTLFRVLFIGIFSYQLSDGLWQADTLTALWYGFRLSLKTAGAVVLIPIVLGSLGTIVWKRWPADAIRNGWYVVMTFLFSLLFMARIPYYVIYTSGFNMMLINGKNDDWQAILSTAVHEYGLVWRLVVALLLACVLCYLLLRWIQYRPWFPEAPAGKKQVLAWMGLCVGIAILAPFIRFGGAFTYNQSINWASAARTKSQLLNEAILDDGQALYRVRDMYSKTQKETKIDFDAAGLRARIQAVGGNPHAATIDGAFRRTVEREYLKTQPRQVFFILGETYALWPFLPQYQALGDYIVQNGKRFAASPESMNTQYMLAHGTGTMPAVNGFLTGLATTGVNPNYEPLSYEAKQAYGMGIAQVMKGLGYKTVFWYGGYGTWQNVRQFALAQGFDEYHDAGELGDLQANSWGVEDKGLFTGIEKYVKAHPSEEKTFYFILTTSNHPPYSVPIEKEGFVEDKVLQAIPDTISSEVEKVREIGHIWYADHVMGQFVDTMQQADPDALFIITGDHAERFSFAKEVDDVTLSAIPCIIYGNGVEPSWMAPHRFASALQITPTIAQLVGRKGQTYDSLLPGLLGEPTGFSAEFVFNHRLWMDAKGMHNENANMPAQYAAIMKDLRDISVWRVKRGNEI